MSMKCIAPYTLIPLLYSKTEVYRGIPIFLIFDPNHKLWVLGERVLTCTHNHCFELKHIKIVKNFPMKFSINFLYT